MDHLPAYDPRWLAVAEQAARAAGRIAVEYRGRATTQSKGLRDIVTEADVLCQAECKRIIAAAFPDHAFLAEEADTTPGGPSDLTWVIDPIDGTTNYAYGLPVFCTSIGLALGDTLLAGVVYDPLRDELYAAGRGQGATLNGTPLRVSDRAALIDAIVGIEWATAPPLRAESVRRVGVLANQCMTVRSPGAAALSLCYVAAGAFDIYFNVHLKPWDVAAGALLIEEAGGQITGLQGEPWTMHSGGILATNGRLHEPVLAAWTEG